MKLDEPVPVEEFRSVVRALVAARGRYVYFIWKVLQEKGLDADALIREPCYRWGVFNEENGGYQDAWRVFQAKPAFWD